MDNNATPATIDEYIAQFSQEIQAVLQQTRSVIRAAAPDAQEKISWGMPTYALHGNVIHFAAQKNHLGIYPGLSGMERFAPEFTGYKTSKGAVQFPYAKPIPFDLIGRIAAFRVQENRDEAQAKADAKAAAKKK